MTEDQISVTEILQALGLDVPVTLAYTSSAVGSPRWRVQIGEMSVYHARLGVALFDCATMYRARQEAIHGH